MGDEQLLREFHDAMSALDRAQQAERPLIDAMANMDPATIPPAMSEEWYRLNLATLAARRRVDAAVRALCDGS